MAHLTVGAGAPGVNAAGVVERVRVGMSRTHVPHAHTAQPLHPRRPLRLPHHWAQAQLPLLASPSFTSACHACWYAKRQRQRQKRTHAVDGPRVR